MKIAYITGGSAGMICGTCMHDNTLASSLMERGHEVSLLPTYTQLRLDEESVATDKIFFGAINVYLQQKAGFFRRFRLFDKLLDSRSVLGLISKLGVSSTSAEDLGSLTLSMMQGENGFQARELDKLVDFLEEIIRPEVVHLSFTLFAGFAKRIKERLGVPVVCSLQGEDLFYDDLIEPYRRQTLEELAARMDDIDLFTSHSRYYADLMSERYGVPRDRTVITKLGIRTEGFRDASERTSNALHIGYLARQCPEKGLHLLVDAFRLAAEDVPELRLHVAGYQGGKDKSFIEEQHQKIDQAGLGHRVLWRGAIDRTEKLRFLADLDLFSVPAVYHEPKGLYVAEALASGVPVLLPNHGAFPEWIEQTGGGRLVESDSAEALAEEMKALARDAEARRELARQGRRIIHGEFHHEAMADEMEGIYEGVLTSVSDVGSGKLAESAA
ncbi:MAG: glycosyltransferase family 4 protein [Thermoanaerobaculia bacterium]|nr:glycosyltransferase family 4 protein [Thermoanaerobaculia bacterium]